jgi:ABC-type nitrate/sulfonate/bicarbonate transport system substrate-binding protein
MATIGGVQPSPALKSPLPMTRQQAARRTGGSGMTTNGGNGGRNTMKAIRIFALALAALLLAHGAQAQQGLTKLRVGKSGGPLLLTLVELGQHAHIWEKEGLDVTSIEFAGEAKMMQALTAGAIDMGFGSGIGMAFPVKGVPATAVAAVSNPPNMLALIVPPDDKLYSTRFVPVKD